MLKLTVVFLSVVCVAFAGRGVESLEKKPKELEGVQGCYISELDAVIPFGESAPAKNSCSQYTCNRSSVTRVSCADSAVLPPCYMVEDNSQPYPECCPRAKCDN